MRQIENVCKVKVADVIIEPNAKNTFQNIEMSMKLLPDMRNENTIVIFGYRHEKDTAEL